MRPEKLARYSPDCLGQLENSSASRRGAASAVAASSKNRKARPIMTKPSTPSVGYNRAVGAGSGKGGRSDGPPTVAERGTREIGRARAGELIGQRYELLEEIGYGAFGRVFRARDRVADTIVALKVFAHRQPPEEVKRLRREVQLAHRVTHPGVVRTYDIVEAEGRICMWREYTGGEALAQRFHRPPPLTAEEVTSLASDLARALAAAHRVGVVHRDLKPANVILRASNQRAVIADFGISRQEEDELDEEAITHDGQVVGTPQYMAPEQLLSGEVGPPADLYA